MGLKAARQSGVGQVVFGTMGAISRSCSQRKNSCSYGETPFGKMKTAQFSTGGSPALANIALPMCCFSRPVQFVSETSIFARPTRQNRQLLAYGMKVGAAEDLAMILPIPVAAGTREDGVDFINLEKYPNLFADLAHGFEPMTLSAGVFGMKGPSRGGTLKVERVGRFVASFVPTVADFGRLDPRFRLPDAVWKRLGQ
jgi:hypothetical protein